jgi:hypothetical protein
MKQGQQPETCFIDSHACFTSMKHDFPQKSANAGPCFTVSLHRDETHETKPLMALPADLMAGLSKLRAMRTPRIHRPELWAGIKADAMRIAAEGWASQAMSLGWDAYALWGVEPSNDPDEFSLAVELAGRSIRAVDEHRFYMRDGDVRSFFERRARPALTKYLWE